MYGGFRCGKISRWSGALINTPVLLSKTHLDFPNPQEADSTGLLALGGDLSPERLLAAYSHGIFPWFEPGYPILWWSPDPRLILMPNQFKMSRSLKQTLQKPFVIKIDTAFTEVVTACATTSQRSNATWITPEMIAAYTELHHRGYAHSIEVWFEEALVGGLYGISLGGAFFGESMFHSMRDTSKLALYYLCQLAQSFDFDFIDCQLPTTHLISLGGEQISRREFLIRLADTLKKPTRVGFWLPFS